MSNYIIPFLLMKYADAKTVRSIYQSCKYFNRIENIYRTHKFNPNYYLMYTRIRSCTNILLSHMPSFINSQSDIFQSNTSKTNNSETTDLETNILEINTSQSDTNNSQILSLLSNLEHLLYDAMISEKIFSNEKRLSDTIFKYINESEVINENLFSDVIFLFILSHTDDDKLDELKYSRISNTDRSRICSLKYKYMIRQRPCRITLSIDLISRDVYLDRNMDRLVFDEDYLNSYLSELVLYMRISSHNLSEKFISDNIDKLRLITYNKTYSVDFMLNHYKLIYWEEIFRSCKDIELLVDRIINSECDIELKWKNISSNTNISERFIMKYKHNINFNILMENKYLSYELISNLFDLLDKSKLIATQFKYLDSDLITDNLMNIDKDDLFELLEANTMITDEYINKYYNLICWRHVSIDIGEISESLLEENIDKLTPYIIINERLSDGFIQKYADRDIVQMFKTIDDIPKPSGLFDSYCKGLKRINLQDIFNSNIINYRLCSNSMVLQSNKIPLSHIFRYGNLQNELILLHKDSLLNTNSYICILLLMKYQIYSREVVDICIENINTRFKNRSIFYDDKLYIY